MESTRIDLSITSFGLCLYGTSFDELIYYAISLEEGLNRTPSRPINPQTLSKPFC